MQWFHNVSMEESDCDGNLESEPFRPGIRNSEHVPSVQKDTLEVKVNLRHKISDASSTDDLSDIEEDAAASGKCKNCRRSRACCITLYLWIVLFFIGSVAGIVVVGIVVVKPFLMAEKFLGTSCASLSSRYGEEELRCSCGKRCNSGYSCLMVNVKIVTQDGKEHETLLYDDESTLDHEVRTCQPGLSTSINNLPTNLLILFHSSYGVNVSDKVFVSLLCAVIEQGWVLVIV